MLTRAYLHHVSPHVVVLTTDGVKQSITKLTMVKAMELYASLGSAIQELAARQAAVVDRRDPK